MITPLLKPSQMKRRRVQVASLSTALAFPKGPTRRQEKDAYDAEEAAWIRRVRSELFALTDRCASCGETQVQTTARHMRNGWAMPSDHHMDEIRSRAHTRGLSYQERFSVQNCRRLCPRCHLKRHGQRVLGDS